MLAYIYFIYRVTLKFTVVPETLYVGISETIFFLGFGSYLFSRTLKNEFLANYKHKKSSMGFKKFLHSLPEGVTIIDDNLDKFNFINSKLKQTVNLDLYFGEASSRLLEIQDFQFNLNKEID